MNNRSKKLLDENLLFLEDETRTKVNTNSVQQVQNNEIKSNANNNSEISSFRAYKKLLDSDKAVENYLEQEQQERYDAQYNKLFKRKQSFFSMSGIKGLLGDARSGVVWFAMFFVSLFALYAVFVVYNTGGKSFIEITGSEYKTNYDGNLLSGDFKFLNKKVNSESKNKLFELFSTKNKPQKLSTKENSNIASTIKGLNIKDSPNSGVNIQTSSQSISASTKGTGKNESFNQQVTRENTEKEISNIKELVAASKDSAKIANVQQEQPPRQLTVSNSQDEVIAPTVRKQEEKLPVPAPPVVQKEKPKKPSLFERQVWQVQIYSSQSVADARKKWTDLQKVNPELFLDQRLHILEANVDGKRYYRLRIGFIHSDDNNKGYFSSKNQATNFCNLLRDEGVDCYPTLTEAKDLK